MAANAFTGVLVQIIDGAAQWFMQWCQYVTAHMPPTTHHSSKLPIQRSMIYETSQRIPTRQIQQREFGHHRKRERFDGLYACMCAHSAAPKACLNLTTNKHFGTRYSSASSQALDDCTASCAWPPGISATTSLDPLRIHPTMKLNRCRCRKGRPGRAPVPE